MKNSKIDIIISDQLYTKNPESTELGRKIVSKSIEMINELGYESFTYKKLGKKIGSNESSIYRYFESKHALLVYLVSWYWSWIEYRIIHATSELKKPSKKLDTAITILTSEVKEDNSFNFINEVLLHKIIISESAKAYHTKDIDKENEKGYYKTYKRVVQTVSNIVLEINPEFKFPNMLISTVIEGAHHQRYFSKHLPSLTNVEAGKNNIVKFYTDLVQKTINDL